MSGSQHDSTKELIRLAGQFSFSDKGADNRSDDGFLLDWPQWAESHPQKEQCVTVCHGREEWSSAASTSLSKSTTSDAQSLYGQCNNNNERKSTTTLSVISWNIFSDVWYQKGRHNNDYAHTLHEHGSWEGRFPLFLKWIEDLDTPDVLALQEVDFDKFHSHLLPQLRARGYDGRMQSPKKNVKYQPCGVATFWRVDKLKLAKGKRGEASFSRSMALVFQLLKREGQNGTDACHDESSSSSNNNNNVCIINVHLESEQSEIGADRRARQLNSPLSWASQVAPSHPIVVCGDCNTGADAALFHVLRNYKWHGHGLASVYEHPVTSQTLPVCRGTFVVPNHHYVIDHMLYSHEMLKLKHALNAFTPEEIDDHLGPGREKGFPDALCPSDHIPIGAIFDVMQSNERYDSPTDDEVRPQELSDGRKDELRMVWESVKPFKPPNGKKKPTAEELEAAQRFKTLIKEWKKSLEGSPAELEYARNLIKGRIT